MFILKFVGVGRSLKSGVDVAFPVRHYAARKGYREKAKKKKVKVEEKKKEFIPHNKRDILQGKPTVSRRIDDSWKHTASDDVYISKFYRSKVYNFAEAVECHRQTHHPTVYNLPNARLNVTIELDMRTEKKTKFVEKFSRMVAIPYPYQHGEERKIVAFCKTPELQSVALNAGAIIAGGSELIKSVQTGEISVHDYDYFVAHSDILTEIVALRGLMKRKFPSARNGTLVEDIEKSIKRFSTGLFYTALRDQFEEDYGWIDACIGTLDMNEEHLEGNLKALLEDVNTMKPRKNNPFITKCLLLSLPSVEKLTVDHSVYVNESLTQKTKGGKEDDEESDEEASRVASTAQAG
ncbi:50S ribosomal protein L1 [Ischnura elegans]|uniref:50S ribosomal protein L1 n=1 Tax=Ischnura elegans TaxID=197161 RepID=UPI001ED8AEF9|nr:50S ribosomal protein L1 [Ischnura elegans]XP_046389759.1 50S ribosomal protein L1 [Ischnura elegans]